MDHPSFLSTEGKVMRGVRRAVSINAPGAGNQWSAVVPGGVQWRVIGASAQFATSAVVGNRFVGVVETVEGVLVYVNSFNNNVAASSARTVVYQRGSTLMPANAPTSILMVPFEPQWLRPGDSIGSSTASMDSGDTYTNITVVVEEVYFTNPQRELERRERDQDRAATDAAILAALGPVTP